MDIKKSTLILGLILLLGTGLRFWHLTENPPSLNWDEVSHAYNAWSLLTTGKDQWGQILPLFNFRAYGDYPTTLNIYATVPSIAVFGATDIAVRGVHALVGVLAIFSAFSLGYFWKKNIQTGLWAGFLMAIEPWGVFTSRTVLQSNWTVLLITLFLALFLRARRSGQKFWSMFAILGLSLWSYHNARIYVPLVCVALLLFWKKKSARVGSLIVLSISVLIILLPVSRSRSAQVGILNPGAISTIENSRNNSSLPKVVARLIYNRPVYFTSSVISHYFDYFSPEYLFNSGGTQYQFSLPKHGLVSWIYLPSFYIGLGVIFLTAPLLGILLLLSPVAAAITVDRFAVVRSTIMLPFVVLAISVGMTRFLNPGHKLLRLLILVVVLGGVGIILTDYYRNYFIDYPVNYSQSWQYGYQQAVNYVHENQAKFDQVVFTKRYGEPHEYVLWYSKVLPSVYQSQLVTNQVNWNFHDNWYWVDGFENYIFVNDWEMGEYFKYVDTSKKYLIVSSPDNIAPGTVVKTINFLDNRSAFVITALGL